MRAHLIELLGIPRGDPAGALVTMDAQQLVNLTQRAVVANTSVADQFTPLFISGVGQPSVDGDILPDAAVRLPTLPVDLLHGYNSGEVLMGPPGGMIPNGSLAYFGKYLGHEAAARILSQYGPATSAAHLIADACMRCSTVRLAQRVATPHGEAQVRLYVFNNTENASFHGADVPAVFGTDDSWSGPDGAVNTSEALVHKVQSIWTGFAKGENLSRLVRAWPEVPRARGGTVGAMVLGILVMAY